MSEARASQPRRWRLPLWLGRPWLLAAITAMAMFMAIATGLAVWFLPSSEEIVAYYNGPAGTPDLSRPHSRHVQTWQRQWDGSRVLHGSWDSYHINSNTPWLRQTYRHGKKHGPEVFEVEGLTYSLQYQDGKQHGPSSVVRSDGSTVYTTTWSRGQLQGDAEHHVSDGRANRYRFANGRVTHGNGRPIQSALLEKLARGEVDEDTADELGEINGLIQVSTDDWPVGRIVTDPQQATDWYGAPRQPWEAMEVLGNAAIVDTAAASEWKESPFFPLGIDAASALVLMARATGCQCDYRYGCVWVTRDVEDSSWSDPTGVCELEPSAGSPLARIWQADCQIDAEFRQQPLAECLSLIAQGHVKIDTSQIDTADSNNNHFPVTTNVTFYLQFRHALAKMLLQAKCRCELHGENLVVLPPDVK
jgi:hypothetical protein